MQLGVSSFAFGWAVGVPGYPPARPFTLSDLLDFVRAQGLAVAQVGDHIPLHTLSDAALDEIRTRAETGTAVRLEIGARGLKEAHLQRYLAVATRLRAPLLRFVIDEGDYHPDVAAVVALLRNALPALAGAGVVLGIENHDRFPVRTLRQIVDAVGSPRVGICLDTANSLGAGEGIAQVIDQLAPVTVNLHVKDFAIRRVDYAMGFVVEGRPAGSGALNVAAVRDAVACYGRCPTAVLETWVPPEPTLAGTLDKERHWVEISLGHLKPLFTA